MKTRILQITEPGKIDLIEKDIEPKDNEILVKTHSASICGTDKNYFEGHIPRGTRFNDTSSHNNGEAHPGFPLLMGHEGSGVVAEVGKNVSDYKVGDRVTAFYWANTMADYFTLPAAEEGYGCYHVPDALSMETATLGEPSACAIYAGLQSGVELGDTVAIVGAGFAGQIIAQTVKKMGAHKVIVIDIVDGKLELAKKLGGADVTLNSNKDHVVDIVQELTGGVGVDVAIEVGGNEKTVQLCTDVLKHGGILGLYSWILDPVTLHIDRWHNNGFGIRTLALMHRIRHDRPWEIQQTFKILEQGSVKVDPLVTHTFSLENAQEAFETAVNNGEACKVFIKP